MKALQNVTPTAEHLPLIQNSRAGVKLIRGAAGSGKTTTAVLRLKQLAAAWLSRRERLKLVEPVKVLVVTFNRTLRGYVAELAKEQVKARTHLDLTVSTFGKWSHDLLASRQLLSSSEGTSKLIELSAKIGKDTSFLRNEAEYVMGRFLPANLGDYLDAAREGRGTSPRMERAQRQGLLNDVIAPYSLWKQRLRRYDWNDLAVELALNEPTSRYDIIIADEAQDFSANQVRALMRHSAKVSSVTFVLDAAQRIYPGGFTWREAGVTINPTDSHRLGRNYRNTREIAAFALPLLEGLQLGDDGTLPDLTSCVRRGDKPTVLKGRYTSQLAYAMNYIATRVDLTKESVAFLKPVGGAWFQAVEQALQRSSYSFVTITRQSEWPAGSASVALSTMNSAKGLEFDHVIILGLNEEVTPHGSSADDDSLTNLRRLLAMAITRARQSVLVGYKPDEMSSLVTYLRAGTYSEVNL